MNKSFKTYLLILGLLFSGSISTFSRPYATFAGFVTVQGCSFYFVIIYDNMETPDPTDDVRLASGWISDCNDGMRNGSGMFEGVGTNEMIDTENASFIEPNYEVVEFSISDESMELYPNPATEEVHIDIQSVNPISGFITNSSGVLIRNVPFDGDGHTLDVSGLSSGIYILRVLGNNDRIYSRQFVVE